MNTNDLSLGFDPTGSTSITGAQLGQLVTSATPSSDRGLVLFTEDAGDGTPNVPNASSDTGNPDWQRYIWVRQSAGAKVPYVWNENTSSDATLLKWQTVAQASIGTYSITGGINGNIALATITDDNVASSGISYSKIYDKPSNILDNTTVFGGVVTGAYNALAFNGTPVTTSVINAGAVTDAKVETAASAATGITYSKLRGSGTAGQLLRTAATTYQMEFFTPSSIVSDAAVVNTTANRVPYATGSAWIMSAPTGNYQFGRLMQQVRAFGTTAVNGTAMAVGAINQNSGTEITELKLANIIPKTATSTFRVRLGGYVSKATNAGAVAIALSKGAVGFSLGATGVDAVSAAVLGTTAAQYMELNYEFTPLSLTAFDIRFTIQYNTATAGVATFNAASGFTPLTAGFAEITEYL